jgi:ketosteroid isomerase-like protein
MRSFWRISATLLITTTIIACQPDVTSLSKEDLTEINNIVESYEQSVIDGNWEAFTNLFSEDAIYMPPNEPIIKGKSDLRKWLGNYPSFPDMVLTANKIEGREDLAYVFGTFSLTMPAEGEEEPQKDIGKLLWILMKVQDGKWYIIAESYSSDLPSLD